MPNGEVRDKVTAYYQRFYKGEGIVGMVNRRIVEPALQHLGLYPEPPARPTLYSTYVYFSDMGKALARIVSIFFNQRQIGPPPRATRNSSQPQAVAEHDSSSDDDQPTQRPSRSKPKKQSPRSSSTSIR